MTRLSQLPAGATAALLKADMRLLSLASGTRRRPDPLGFSLPTSRRLSDDCRSELEDAR